MHHGNTPSNAALSRRKRFCLTLLATAALSACGGGDGAESSSATQEPLTASSAPNAGAAGDGQVRATTQGDQARAQSAGNFVRVASEGGSFVAKANQTVRYGSAGQWIVKKLSGAASCSNAFFGSDPDVGVVKECDVDISTGDVNWTTAAAEGGTFVARANQTVRYGSGSSWIYERATGPTPCSNEFFGNDPLHGVVKSCQVDPDSGDSRWLTVAFGGDAFTVGSNQTVRYGAEPTWVSKKITGGGSCSNDFFGSDPAPGVAKVCQYDADSGVSSWAKAAAENGALTLAQSQFVRYGSGATWTQKLLQAGSYTCSNALFGDPLYGVVKECDVQGAAVGSAAAPMVNSLMPWIDVSKAPSPVVGFAGPRVVAANVADPSQNPAPSDIGDFREYCEFSHMSYDDPIVSPGMPGAHLHTFMGNTGTNRSSTAASIAGSGNSTCSGGTLNRTAYWFPSMIDTKDGTPLAPLGSLIYYKQGYNYIASAAIKKLPAGLRIIAGSSGSSSPQDNANFTCFKPDGSFTNSRGIPTDCAVGSTLQVGIAFPQCWDGVNLDSPDHRSHMAYPGFGCPATHPVPVVGITFNINYKVTSAEGTKNWRLASDNYDKSLPGGYSSHADWFGGWDDAILTTWTTRCINATMDCHAFLIGDGRILY